MSEQVNIEQIMEQIRQEIREKGISLDIPEFAGASEKPLACRSAVTISGAWSGVSGGVSGGTSDGASRASGVLSDGGGAVRQACLSA